MLKIKIAILLVLLFPEVQSLCAQNTASITILDSEEVRTEAHSWILLSVETTPDCTVIEKMLLPIVDEKTWICSTKEEFIEDAVTGEKYFILDSEIGFEPGLDFIEGYKGRTFKETYPALPESVTHINVSSGAKYFIKHLDLSLKTSPAVFPISDISFFGVHIGADHNAAVKALKRQGFKTFFKEEREAIIWGGRELNTCLYRPDDEYPVTIQLNTDVRHNIITSAEVMYQNHIDKYEVYEHLQELEDVVKEAYPYRYFEECTPEYMHASGMLDMKSGKGRIFKNVTVVNFRGYYYICDSSEDIKNDSLGTISFEVHTDYMHNDYVIVMRYSDRTIGRYVRRSYGEYRW
ncbi:MAG: hypothetical protein K2H95_07025 [Bacteroidales bacterium]|nr:hypothetical protein [Bacteroidales bacterium]